MHLTLSKAYKNGQPRHLNASNFNENYTKGIIKHADTAPLIENFKVPSFIKNDDLSSRLPKSTSVDVVKYFKFKKIQNLSREIYETVERTSPVIKRKFRNQSM